MKAALLCHNKCVKSLIRGGANLNLQNKAGDTALLLAVERSEFSYNKCVETLIQAGTDVNMQNGYSQTALMTKAVEKYNVEMLIRAGADINLLNGHYTQSMWPVKYQKMLFVAAKKFVLPELESESSVSHFNQKTSAAEDQHESVRFCT